MRAKKLFCVLAAVSLLGHGASLLLSRDAAGQPTTAGKPAAAHRLLLCPLL
jgi:hypothetical protein